jgi:hypothetical protein
MPDPYANGSEDHAVYLASQKPGRVNRFVNGAASTKRTTTAPKSALHGWRRR